MVCSFISSVTLSQALTTEVKKGEKKKFLSGSSWRVDLLGVQSSSGFNRYISELTPGFQKSFN